MIGGLGDVRIYDRAVVTDVPIELPVSRSDSLPHGALALAGLAGTAGVIHFVATIEHIGSEWDLAVFFALVGAGQVTVGWRIYREVYGVRLLTLAAGVNLVVALLWIWSRTAGMPFGPESDGVVKVGAGDAIATLLELAFVALVAITLTRGARALAWFSSGLGVRLTFAVLSLCLMTAAFGGHQH